MRSIWAHKDLAFPLAYAPFMIKSDTLKAIMADNDRELVTRQSAPVTPERLRGAATQAELRGDWFEAELMQSCADKIIQLEAQNQAYRHALANGVSINLISKRRWFHIRSD